MNCNVAASCSVKLMLVGWTLMAGVGGVKEAVYGGREGGRAKTAAKRRTGREKQEHEEGVWKKEEEIREFRKKSKAKSGEGVAFRLQPNVIQQPKPTTQANSSRSTRAEPRQNGRGPCLPSQAKPDQARPSQTKTRQDKTRQAASVVWVVGGCELENCGSRPRPRPAATNNEQLHQADLCSSNKSSPSRDP